eukprot:1161708-Pelagomonas_calceolata.AAC.5
MPQVVEMAPSLGLNPKTRAALLEEAVRLVKHVGYRNAGEHDCLCDLDVSSETALSDLDVDSKRDSIERGWSSTWATVMQRQLEARRWQQGNKAPLLLEQLLRPACTASITHAQCPCTEWRSQSAHSSSSCTVEFMVDKQDRYYFLEVNPRVQLHSAVRAAGGAQLVKRDSSLRL